MASSDEPWKQLYQYWLDKHVDGHPPCRADLDPVLEIPKLLKNLILVDILPDGLVYRLVGSGLERGVGQGMSGLKPGASGKFQNVAKSWIDAIEFVRDNGKPRLLVPRFADGVRASGVAIFLPLIGPDHKTAMVMGAYFNQGVFPPYGGQIEALSVMEFDA
jgi:hypothetical protein